MLVLKYLQLNLRSLGRCRRSPHCAATTVLLSRSVGMVDDPFFRLHGVGRGADDAQKLAILCRRRWTAENGAEWSETDIQGYLIE